MELARVRLPPEALARSGQFLSWTRTHSQTRSVHAGREYRRLRRAKGSSFSKGTPRAERESFAVETTLSGKNYLQMMQYAKGIDRGFEVVLIYIGTESVEINLARIAGRVLAGGHNVPEMDVRRRYLRSLQNLPAAAGIADRVLLFDNTDDLGYRPVGLLDRELHQWFHPLPVWAAELHARLPQPTNG
jgi:predicted ABC-type ATPase